jgi:hypothetical protein
LHCIAFPYCSLVRCVCCNIQTDRLVCLIFFRPTVKATCGVYVEYMSRKCTTRIAVSLNLFHLLH